MACTDAGLKYGHRESECTIFHDLRRSAKTGMVRAGVDKVYRDLILGHSRQGVDRNYIVEGQFEAELIRAMATYATWMDSERKNVTQTVAKIKQN